jgi:hypothetical protein
VGRCLCHRVGMTSLHFPLKHRSDMSVAHIAHEQLAYRVAESSKGLCVFRLYWLMAFDESLTVAGD